VVEAVGLVAGVANQVGAPLGRPEVAEHHAQQLTQAEVGQSRGQQLVDLGLTRLKHRVWWYALLRICCHRSTSTVAADTDPCPRLQPGAFPLRPPSPPDPHTPAGAQLRSGLWKLPEPWTAIPEAQLRSAAHRSLDAVLRSPSDCPASTATTGRASLDTTFNLRPRFRGRCSCRRTGCWCRGR